MKNRLTPLLLACLSLLLLVTGSAFGQRRSHSPGPARAAAHDPVTLQKMVEQAALEAGISPSLFRQVVQTESSGKWWAVSPKGAAGLAQLMPYTAARFGVRNRFDPMENLRGGARYLRYLLDYFKGDVRLALAGYNAGEGAVMKFGGRIPPYRETQKYVARIYPRFVRDATASSSASAGVVQTSYRPQTAPSGLKLLPVQVNSKAKAMELARGRGVIDSGEKGEVQEVEAGPKEDKSRPRPTGASVYLWPAPARLSASVIPQ